MTVTLKTKTYLAAQATDQTQGETGVTNRYMKRANITDKAVVGL
jgi:hypothetical protein